MRITNIEIFLPEENDNEKIKAYATITFDNCFVVRNMRLVAGDNRLFVAMPSRRRVDGTFNDIAHPITREMRDELEEKIVKAYQEKRESGK